ncbi:MAG: LD-carboxypeptidase [Bacteroidetes bacterium]|nr:LD-carboxypeptidase [Bacteroidota bacterium]
MITPPYLKQGDKIGIIAPARRVSPEDITAGIDVLRNAGFEVVEGKNLYNQMNIYAGTDNERAADLQDMIDRKDISAIIAARGGYGCVRVVDDVDFAPLINNPKWLIGFSDITVFHSHLHHNYGIETLHSHVLTCYKDYAPNNHTIESLLAALKGETLHYTWPTDTDHQHLNKHGEITAEIIGGNLSILHNLTGTNSDLDVAGKILFIEDIDEQLYHIDRMMVHLKRCGKIDLLAGLVVGAMTDMKDNEKVAYGKNVFEIIHEHVHEIGFPVVFDFPAGHQPENAALILGREVTLSVTEDGNSLLFHEGDLS